MRTLTLTAALALLAAPAFAGGIPAGAETMTWSNGCEVWRTPDRNYWNRVDPRCNAAQAKEDRSDRWMKEHADLTPDDPDCPDDGGDTPS